MKKMMGGTHVPKNIDEYIANFPRETQETLTVLRKTIGECAPEAGEKISYGIPTFTLQGNLVHFAGYKNHIGFYPGSAGVEEFKKDLAPYKCSKGTIQFPLHTPLPLPLIKKIVKFRVKKNLEKK